MRRDQDARQCRLGEMVREQKLTIGLAKGGRPKAEPAETTVSVPTFASQGIDKNLAAQARTLSDLPEERFEERVAEAREAALGVVERVVRRQARETAKHDREQPYGKPTDHPAAPRASPEGQGAKVEGGQALAHGAAHARWLAARLFQRRPAFGARHSRRNQIFSTNVPGDRRGERQERRPRADPSVGVQLGCHSGPPDNGGQGSRC